MTDIHSNDILCTKPAPATLATAKHGGCVQLGKIHVRESLLRHLVRELNHARRGFDSAVRADYVHRCLLSVLDASDGQQPAAQPSPGGQGDALLREVSAQLESLDCGACIGSDAPMEDLHGRIAAHLAAHQPVGEPVDDDAASEAFGEFADDYLTDGNGYAQASTYGACSKAFNAAWPDRAAATDAARAELKRLHGDDRTVGARRAEAMNRSVARDDAEDDAAPPAQAVDLGRARDEGHDGAIRYVLGYLNGVGDRGSTMYEEILNSCGRERIIRSAIKDDELGFTGLGWYIENRGSDEERALIGSQAVGSG